MTRTMKYGGVALAALFCAALAPGCCALAEGEPGLAVETGPAGKAYLTYAGKPLFAFGPGDEMRLLSGAADVTRWAAWQQAHGMNLVRAYPASVPVEAYGAPGLHPFQRVNDLWDVDQWNEAYFAHLGEVARILEEHGICLHLQLWQIVWFKGGAARWEINYLNPKNNLNEWTRPFSRGRDYIDAPPESPARAHQEAWVRRILDAVADRNNVWIDVINELGNEMGSLDWARDVVRWIRAWERERGRTFLVGVDSEHHYRPEVFGPVRDEFDLIILNELRSQAHARNVIEAFNLPTVTVRSSDETNQWDHYMFANAEQTGPEHQTRYRTLCYRALFAGVQSVGAYWKPEVAQADYADMEHWPVYARALRTFWNRLAPHWPELAVDNGTLIAGDTVTPHAYDLRGSTLCTIYLECGPRTHDNAFPPSALRIKKPFDTCHVECFDPKTGAFTPAGMHEEEGALIIDLPAFTDDLAIVITSGAP